MKWVFTKEYVELGFRHWYLTFYFNPKVWGFRFHRNAPCCKFWLLLGPFELNRTWTDDDNYPFDFDDEAA